MKLVSDKLMVINNYCWYSASLMLMCNLWSWQKGRGKTMKHSSGFQVLSCSLRN